MSEDWDKMFSDEQGARHSERREESAFSHHSERCEESAFSRHQQK
jgi:hypothetical protein